jgi:plastocyanin domain-containing protein
MRPLFFVLVLLVFLVGACAKQEQTVTEQQQRPETTPAVETSAVQTSETAVQEHTIEVAGDFTPPSVTLKAGQPARLHFRRGDKASCADEIVFPDLNIRKKLAVNETVTIDVPAQQARTLSFACGMNMMKGTVVVQ